jgi:hypothetical protein
MLIMIKKIILSKAYCWIKKNIFNKRYTIRLIILKIKIIINHNYLILKNRKLIQII